MMRTFLAILVILLALILFQREFARPSVDGDPVPDTVYQVRWEYDTTPLIIKVPKPVPVETIIMVPPPDVDTAAIIAAYYSKNIYHRTLMDDTTAFLSITDTVFNNRLLSGQVTYINRSPVTIHETYYIYPKEDPRFRLYLGGHASGNLSSFSGGPGIFAMTRNDRLYGIAYDPFLEAVQLHAYWKISFGRKR